jgi:two-component system, LuxR family, response regulator FixJ
MSCSIIPFAPNREILVVDDDPEVLRVVATWLRAAFERVTVYHDPAALLADANGSTNPAPIVVTDIRMPSLSGIELLQALRETGAKVIVMSGAGDAELSAYCVHLGAVACLEKPLDAVSVLSAVRSCTAHPGATNGTSVGHDAGRRLSALTSRQREVFRRIASGQTNLEVAYDLGISVKTVEVHRANVMRIMRVRTLAELVRVAVALEQRGLLAPFLG